MDIKLRREKESDDQEVEKLTRDAFWNVHVPGCSEHYLAHIMRESKDFVKELDYVACWNDKILGNIMYTKAVVLGDDGVKHPVLCFGPISVLPEFQDRGIGTRLIEHTKEMAKEIGYKAILIFGDPEYYKRVGFTGAESFEIGTAWDTYAVPLLACELIPGALEDCKGRFFESTVYEVDEDKAEAFDQMFEAKEKVSGLPTQARFSELAAMNKPRR
ncbi:MAG: N-acetyltransferase [Bacillota bacterium]|nr:N-acetyltransferase [Bacillota bacterium]